VLTRIDLRGRRDADLTGVLPRAELDVAAAVEQVRPVVEDVRDRGAAAVREATARFDGVTLTDLRVPAAALTAALEQLDPAVRAALEEAIRRAGLEPQRTAIRGGTDGSALTEMGLPTPNLFTGGHDAHSEREWICVEDLGLAAATLVELAHVWAE